MPPSPLRLLRATGADLPFGRPEAGHPGVALESFFWRLTSPRRVVLCAVTACRDARGEPWASVALAALLGDGTRIVRTADLGSAAVDADRLGVAAGGGALRGDADGLWVDLGPDARLDVRFDAPWRWPRRSLGGLGLGHVVPGLTQYWHPHMLGGRVRGTATLGPHALRLDGANAYGEKNWGRSGVPPAWWWGQAAPHEDVMVAFAGGVLEAKGLRASATSVAVRLGEDLLSCTFPLALVTAQVSAEGWRIHARDGRSRVEVTATAPSPPFDLPVPIAAERRTELLSHQHEDGELELAVWRGRRLAYRGRTARAGLERGGLVL